MTAILSKEKNYSFLNLLSIYFKKCLNLFPKKIFVNLVPAQQHANICDKQDVFTGEKQTLLTSAPVLK